MGLGGFADLVVGFVGEVDGFTDAFHEGGAPFVVVGQGIFFQFLDVRCGELFLSLGELLLLLLVCVDVHFGGVDFVDLVIFALAGVTTDQVAVQGCAGVEVGLDGSSHGLCDGGGEEDEVFALRFGQEGCQIVLWIRLLFLWRFLSPLFLPLWVVIPCGLCGFILTFFGHDESFRLVRWQGTRIVEVNEEGRFLLAGHVSAMILVWFSPTLLPQTTS